MEEDLENVGAAWRHAIARRRADVLSDLMDGPFTFWTIRSRFPEGELHFAQAVAAWQAEPGDPKVFAGLQARLGWFLFQRGQLEQSRRLLWKSAERQRGEESLDRLFSLAYLGAVLRHGGNYEEARGILAEGLQLAEKLGDGYYASVMLNALGQVTLAQD
jgi:tetratricopeptide (TPR) repeat protein